MPCVPRQDLAGGVLGTRVENAIHDRVLAGDAPYPPALGRRPLHQPPPRLVRADDRGLEDVLSQGVVRRSPHIGDRGELIPECLRVDHEPFTPHDPSLAFEGKMIGVFAHRNLDRKLRRIARSARVRTSGQTERPRRRRHTAVAATAIFLTPMAAYLATQRWSAAGVEALARRAVDYS